MNLPDLRKTQTNPPLERCTWIF